MALYKDEDERRRVRAELQARRKRRDDYAEAVMSRRSEARCFNDSTHRSRAEMIWPSGRKLPIR